MDEAFLRAFHAARPGCTHRALARGGSYALVGDLPGVVLDLGCGSAPLAAIGCDLSIEELRLARGDVVQARGQALPFRDACFDGVVSHLALMLMPLDATLAEIRRVLVPGGVLRAVIGGGPVRDDAFEAFAKLLPPRRSIVDPRLRSSAGIAAAFAAFADVTQTDHHVELGGTFDDVWTFLSSSYQLDSADAPRIEAALRARFGAHADCTIHVRLVEARR